MYKYIAVLSIILFSGCGYDTSLNRVSFKGLTCLNDGDISIVYKKGNYQCIRGKKKYIKPRKIKIVKKHSFLNPSWLNVEPIKNCDTTVTQHYYAKNGKVTTTCKGKILEPGQKTRKKIVRE